MANSAFLLSSGLGSDGKSIRATKTQSSHGFSAGSVIRFVQASNGVAGSFKLAQASSGISAEAVGIVESVSASGNEFTVVYGGEIDTANFVTVPKGGGYGQPNGGGNTGSDVWFLDPTRAGGLTATAPTSSGNIVKPVLTLVSGTNQDRGIVTNYVGQVIGGSNTVSLDNVHPVGEIIAWGGSVSDIPSGWQLCDGSTLDASLYPKYYSRVGTKYGYHAKMDFLHQGHTGFACSGNTATQTFGSTVVPSQVLSYTHSSGTPGSVLVDANVLVGLTHGAESSTDNTGYPHGHIYDNSRTLTMRHHNSACSYQATVNYTVNVATVQYVKTPDLRARTILGAGATHGAFDGYTAGQVGGSEDADTIGITLGSGKTAYAAIDTGNANLRQPYMAAHHIIRIDDTAQAALVDGLNVTLADSGLTDHDTSLVSDGDITVYDQTNSLYKPIKLLSDFPGNVSTFESKFQIRADSDASKNGYISIGHIAGDYPIHIKDTTPEIRLTDTDSTDGDEYIRIYVNNSGGAVATKGGHPLYLSGGGHPSGYWAFIDKAADNLLSLNRNVDILNNLGVTGDCTIKGTTRFQGQAYSPIVSGSSDSDGTWTPDFNDGVVQRWTTTSANALTIENPSNINTGGMYTLCLENDGGAVVNNLQFGNKYKFANGIAPNLIRANSWMVISIVAGRSSELLCTWAEDFS